MQFATSIHCMDGRIQGPLIHYIKDKYHVQYVDVITEPGSCKIMAENVDGLVMQSIDKRITISVQVHGSKLIFLSGHYDCAGNPVPKEIQVQQVVKGADVLQSKYPDVEVVKLWVNENWEVEEL
ncbi:hypothetical protein HQ585_08090 [candidate division KSB1 bacterium]|nr:hypothetical protein [candidate division KSB1 bacterium]